MSNSTDLSDRIDAAIARVKASRAADEVLTEIATTHVLVPKSLAERAAQARGMGSRAAFDRGVICGDLARYWEEQRS